LEKKWVWEQYLNTGKDAIEREGQEGRGEERLNSAINGLVDNLAWGERLPKAAHRIAKEEEQEES